MTPSQEPFNPMPDRRKNVEITDDEVQDHIAKRDEHRKRARTQTIGGLLLGTVGVAIAGFAGFVTQNIWMTIIGFLMGLIGYGFSSPREAADMVRSILGRNGRDSK